MVGELEISSDFRIHLLIAIESHGRGPHSRGAIKPESKSHDLWSLSTLPAALSVTQ